MFAWWGSTIVANAWGAPPIDVVKATYGENCQASASTESEKNLLREGNVTSKLRNVCQYNECSILIDSKRFGNPAPTCAKDFSVDYRCKIDNEIRKASVAADATGKTVKLDCYSAPPKAIRIVSATYGRSCIGFKTTTGAQNWAREGNVTEVAQKACNESLSGKTCKFIVDNTHWGDPAQGCGKDFSASYQCKGERKIKTANIAAEAAGKTVDLDCSAPPQ